MPPSSDTTPPAATAQRALRPRADYRKRTPPRDAEEMQPVVPARQAAGPFSAPIAEAAPTSTRAGNSLGLGLRLGGAGASGVKKSWAPTGATMAKTASPTFGAGPVSTGQPPATTAATANSKSLTNNDDADEFDQLFGFGGTTSGGRPIASIAPVRPTAVPVAVAPPRATATVVATEAPAPVPVVVVNVPPAAAVTGPVAAPVANAGWDDGWDQEEEDGW
jgi:hypothetical protein